LVAAGNGVVSPVGRFKFTKYLTIARTKELNASATVAKRTWIAATGITFDDIGDSYANFSVRRRFTLSQ
jgi:hypothetical protein